ncbi:tbc1 domain family member gtpase-activating protein [Holotrichia oblita]|uniref:Tbc1 domain family member gtpase-activating protein n=1 Tax=Holotrichia oblita TaxID=644536 RepID=A0ACB9SS46_HOLOL|nr:tbc1 domain family member gtpase-activating protein [Holotrichia oblita]
MLYDTLSSMLMTQECEIYYAVFSEVSDVDQDCTIFSGVTYLGAASINAPKSETEIQRNMAFLNEQTTDQGIKVSVSVPCSSQGLVVLYDSLTHSVIARYEIHRILFYARGVMDSKEASCFAFTWSHGDTQESAIFQCHVFRCDISEAVSRVSACFAKAFQRVPRSMSSSVASTAEMTSSITTMSESRHLMSVFEVNLEIKEDDGKGTFSMVAKDRSGFKLRVNLEKQLCLSIRQVSDNGPQLSIERYFGVLVAAGRHVRHSDMQLLEMEKKEIDKNIKLKVYIAIAIPIMTYACESWPLQKKQAKEIGNNSDRNEIFKDTCSFLCVEDFCNSVNSVNENLYYNLPLIKMVRKCVVCGAPQKGGLLSFQRLHSINTTDGLNTFTDETRNVIGTHVVPISENCPLIKVDDPHNINTAPVLSNCEDAIPESDLEPVFSSDSSDNFVLVNEEESSSENEEQPPMKLTRGRRADKTRWKRNICKKRRMSGLPYETQKGVHSAKLPRDVNCIPCKYKCSESFDGDFRCRICSEFWKLDYNHQKDYILSCVVSKQPKCKRPRTGTRKPKESSRCYYFHKGGTKIRDKTGPNYNSNSVIDRNCTMISASWDPTESAFESLNTETPKDVRQYMTVAVDLVIRGIQEPVRFQIETPVRIYGQAERFWYFQKRSLIQQFFLNLKEIVNLDLTDIYYEVLSMETSGELDRNRLNLTLNLSSLIQSPSITSIDTITPKDENASDGDEPLLSGTGLVSKDCAEDVLENWADVLQKWKTTHQRPKQLNSLVKLGIPEALRGEVWQRLTGSDEVLLEKYRLLITQESACENVIQRDIARTFPAHDFFKEAGGLGQDSLYRVSKAYAVYDSEVGYCQGLSFLAATLLLHMPEEQAFGVLVKLMYQYGLRDLYKDGFDNLYLRLYQLNKLMEEQLGPLYQHFNAHSIETHMFASQWFLTLFTARFPLYFVFHIIDVFLLQGIETLFQVALALLTMCMKDLLSLDFEGILKYFRVSLPKKCRSEETAKQIMKKACAIKVKKLKKYEADFIALNEAADNEESSASEVVQLQMTIQRYEEEKRLMLDEIVQLKEILKREVTEAETEKKSTQNIINEYKIVRQRLDNQLNAANSKLDLIKEKISSCENCSQLFKENDTKEIFGGGDTGTTNLSSIERIRELELELAQVKLAQVEAECKNQDLIHKLRSTEQELSSAKNSWPPWLSKTLTSIKEVANKKDFANLYNPQHVPNTTPTFVSHINTIRRESVPTKTDNYTYDARRESAPIIKDSQSCSNLKTQN